MFRPAWAECISANWYAIGLEDGTRGRAQHRVTFCTHERGFSVGRAGQAYAGACPPAMATNFQTGYQLGCSEAALKDGIPNPRLRATEVEP